MLPLLLLPLLLLLLLLLFCRKFLVNGLDLLSHVEILQMADVLSLALEVSVEAVDSRFLPPCFFFFSDWQSRDFIEDIGSLTGQPLEVVGHVYRR